MTAAVSVSTEEKRQENEGDLMAMVEEIGTAVATGLIPVVGQAINIYDTIESLLVLRNSQGAEAQDEAKFDLVLALVGWVPGAGGGVKKTIRIVNKNPARYAPILFDVLRMVCLKLGIQTNPESLLDRLFDAAGFKAVLGTAQSSVESSWAYKRLPSEAQQGLSSTLATVRSSLPAMLLLVTIKLTKWKRMQRNTAARSTGARRKDASARKPAAKHPDTAQKGANTPAQVPGNTAGNAVIGTASLSMVTNEVIGMLGEHITDYFLYEEYGWGKHWSAHDMGTTGSWETKPGKNFPGKLNEGTKLNPLLAAKAHGVGIDGVWKVQLGDPHNAGKPYAIVESKASSHNNSPLNSSRKPGISGKLLSNSRRIRRVAAAKALVAPQTEDLLDPPTNEGSLRSTSQSTGRKNGRNSRKPANLGRSPHETAARPVDSSNEAVSEAEKPIVQMSQRWISKNINMAVADRSVRIDFQRNGIKIYSRHLFYTPFYLPTAAEHILALRNISSSSDKLHSNHTNHLIPSTHCHDELEVKIAVNSKLRRMNLKQEP